jgi:transcriptional regulator GlxA family with amidase domain
MPLRSFSRQFFDEVGTSPMRWLTAERVREACRLLEATNLSVEEISALTGLGSAATLRTHFERAMRLSPTRYRSLHRGAASVVPG